MTNGGCSRVVSPITLVGSDAMTPFIVAVWARLVSGPSDASCSAARLRECVLEGEVSEERGEVRVFDGLVPEWISVPGTDSA